MSIDINNIKLTMEQRQQLAQLSEHTGLSPSELINNFLKQFPVPEENANGNAQRRTLYDAFAEDGSIGMVKGGPTDVSTNPKYLEGFGRSAG